MVAFFGPLGWSAARCARLNAAHLDYLARWTVEVGRLFHQPPEEIVGRIQLVGEEHLKAALARGRGVMLLITHMGTNLHIGCALGARGYRLVGVFNARSIAGRRYFSRLAARHRVEFAFVGRNGGFAARRTLRNSGIFALAMDGDARENRATPVRFGHVRMPVDLGPAALALRTRCAVVLGTSRQIGDGRSLVTFLPDPAIKSLAQTSPDPGVLCEQWLQVFYDDLLACPEQWWLWSFSKFSPPDPPHSTTCSEATQR
jgi:KDO2-lipid IV(A) lauroyltransferase